MLYEKPKVYPTKMESKSFKGAGASFKKLTYVFGVSFENFLL
jgi:hypothetical protein